MAERLTKRKTQSQKLELSEKDLRQITLKPSQQEYLQKIMTNDITFCYGPAGTSKTFTAGLAALTLYLEGKIKKIFLTKPIQESGEKLGFLPGEIKDKIDPFMESFKSNAKKLFNMTNVDGLFESSVIHFLPLAYIRGTNLDNSIIIQDVTDNHFVILIAEDNVEIRNLIHEHFCKDYNIVLTENGLEAWEQACEIIPDIIISDVMMPIMDGFTLCEKIKSDNRTSHIPVVLLTAKNAEKDQITGLETGADIYISKPFSIKILELSIRNIIQAREKLRQKFNTQLVKLHQQEIVPNSTDHLFINTVERDFLVNVINIIESHLDDPEFGVDKLAKKVAMSTPILYKKIKAVSNMSVNDFVKSIRLKKGAQLLLEKTLTINEVSFTVGFNDRKYFSREFKKQYGVNPKDYVSNNI
jgi:DNA-binding response OmpR family regulator